jgi:hypothetical protein
MTIADGANFARDVFDIAFIDKFFDTGHRRTSGSIVDRTTENNNVDVGIFVTDNPSGSPTIEIGQIQIEEDEIRLQIFELLDRTIAICGNAHDLQIAM